MKNGFKYFALIFLGSVLFGCSSPEHTVRSPSSDTVQSVKTSADWDAKTAWEEFESYFRLFYAYLDTMDFDVEAALEAVEMRALKTEAAADFRQELVRFGHIFADPHIIIGPLEDHDFNVVPTSADLRVIYQDNRYVVSDVRAGSAADLAGIEPEFQLTEVEAQAISSQVAEFFTDFVSEPTARQKSHAATLLANGQRVGTRSLTFAEAGEFTLPNTRDYARFLQNKPTVSVTYEDETAIIRVHNALGNNETIKAFDAAMVETASAPSLIIDLRETPSGGNTEVGRSIIGHFVTEPRPYQTHKIPSLEREFTVPRQFTEYVLPRAPYRDPASTVALGGYWTGSMGEGIVIGLDGAADMHIIASDMGDLLGGLSNYTLNKSGIRLDLPSEVLLHIDGTPREDFEADLPLFSAERDTGGGDPAMKAALKHLQRYQNGQ